MLQWEDAISDDLLQCLDDYDYDDDDDYNAGTPSIAIQTWRIVQLGAQPRNWGLHIVATKGILAFFIAELLNHG